MENKKTHCRLVWEHKSKDLKDNGAWFPITQKNIVEQWVKIQNEKYPILHTQQKKNNNCSTWNIKKLNFNKSKTMLF